MKIKIFFVGIIAVMALWMNGCGKFLDVTTDKSGSAYIYHMDQLLGLTGSPDLYFLTVANNPIIISIPLLNQPNAFCPELLLLGDGAEYSPQFWRTAMRGSNEAGYRTYCLEYDHLIKPAQMTYTWVPSWSRIYTFNTALEQVDKVIQTTPEARKQVEGEALFGRAYYHFLLLVQYSLWNEDAPGIGYRTNTDPAEVPERMTVQYTLDGIFNDLENAEAALRAAGRTHFELKRSFRPTVPTVQAFRARVELYRGNYPSALKYATDALTAHSVLVDFKNDPLYERSAQATINLLDPTDTFIAGTLTGYAMPKFTDMNRMFDNILEYSELYLPSITHAGNSNAPLSESYYKLFDKEQDARWIHFYSSLIPIRNASGVVQPILLPGGTANTPACFKWADQQWVNPANYHTYNRFLGMAYVYILGMTTAEMHLIRAECLARNGNSAEAATVLKTLRRTRFMTQSAADNIGGSVQEVLDERAREMTSFWRFFDIKRLNGAEKAGITIRRDILTDLSDINSVKQLVITPEDGRWALPIGTTELALMRWEQNEGWE
jgi:hypothetical protein